MSEKYEFLIEENSQLKRALHTSNHYLEKTKSNFPTIK